MLGNKIYFVHVEMLKRCVCGMHYRRNELFTKISVNHTAKFSCDFSRYNAILQNLAYLESLSGLLKCWIVK